MVAVTKIEAEVKRSRSKSPHSSKRSKDKMGKSSSPNHQPQLLRMLEEDCHNSFLKLPDEEPIHIWNTPPVEAHHQRMKKLDKKLAKYNDDIAKLKELLRQADEQTETELERMEQREQEARQEIVDLEAASHTVEKDAMSTEVQFQQLQARLQANMYKITELRAENKNVTKDLRKAEKQMDKIKYNNIKLEESSKDLFASYEDLCSSKAFDEHNFLCNNWEEGREEFEHYKDAVQVMQERYMVEAQDRLQLQTTMAEILSLVQGTANIPGTLANTCTQIGLDCQARAVEIMGGLEEKLEAQEALETAELIGKQFADQQKL